MTQQKGRCVVCGKMQKIEYGVVTYHEVVVSKGRHNKAFRQCDGTGKRPKVVKK